MKVRAVRKHIELSVVTGAPASPSSYEVALGQEYIVFTVDCYYDSREMEGSTLYGIEDEYGRLMLYPAALFEITDARASKYWLAGYSEGSFYLRPQEFVDNVYLSDDIHEDLPGARAKFREIKERFESEVAE